jgi:hypothetical protein
MSKGGWKVLLVDATLLLVGPSALASGLTEQKLHSAFWILQVNQPFQLIEQFEAHNPPPFFFHDETAVLHLTGTNSAREESSATNGVDPITVKHATIPIQPLQVIWLQLLGAVLILLENLPDKVVWYHLDNRVCDSVKTSQE